MRLLLDINVLLDVVFNRPGASGSSQILDLCEAGAYEGEVAWHTLPTVFYYLERSRSNQESWEYIKDLVRILHVVEAGHAAVTRAFNYGMKDFEDALQVSAALACQSDFIITRNVADFAQSAVTAVMPEDFLAQFPPSN
jgi:predicted nucleic acid-binding protein